MTEEEWLSVQSSEVLLTFIDQRRDPGQHKRRIRRLRLMRSASFRLDWEQLPDDVLQKAVVTAELFADGECSLGYLSDVQREVANTAHWLQTPYVEGCYRLLDPTAKRRAIDYLRFCKSSKLCHVIRDIFGNPFRSISFDVSWRTETAVAIARQMYESRDFSAMPILADALQDAGCESDDVLAHCRAADGVHVRGCWVVDCVLDKS